MKCQIIFSEENLKQNVSKHHLLIVYPSVLSFKLLRVISDICSVTRAQIRFNLADSELSLKANCIAYI